MSYDAYTVVVFPHVLRVKRRPVFSLTKALDKLNTQEEYVGYYWLLSVFVVFMSALLREAGTEVGLERMGQLVLHGPVPGVSGDLT